MRKVIPIVKRMILLSAAVLFILVFQFSLVAFASESSALLELRSQDSEIEDDENFTVEVLVSTKGHSVVAVNSIIAYDVNKVQYVGYDTQGSIFNEGNSCTYNGKPCQIVNTGTSGKISITMAKPKPGVNVEGGLFVKLKFKALEGSDGSAVKLEFNTFGNYDDSDVIIDDGKGTDVLGSVKDAQIAIRNKIKNKIESRINDSKLNDCRELKYSDWDTCQADGTQTRKIISSSSNTCQQNAILKRSCTFSASKTSCEKFSYTSWDECVGGRQKRKVANAFPLGCSGGNPILSQNCQSVQKTEACDRFTYTAWGACINGVKRRQAVSGFPYGCKGGSPLLETKCY